MAKLSREQKYTLVTALVLLAVLFGVKWVLEHSEVKIFPYNLFPSISSNSSNTPKTPPHEPTEEQRYKLLLYEKTLNLGLNYAEFARLRAIAQAESGWKQYDSEGNVLKGYKDGKDIGLFQIRETIHRAEAEKKGYDIYTPEGNISYAVALYEKQGTTPWNASKGKWSR